MNNRDNTKEAEEILSRISAELTRQNRMQAELVAYLDLPKGVYSNWKAGNSRNFCEHLGAISKFLNVSAEYLVTGKYAEKNLENPREIELLNWYPAPILPVVWPSAVLHLVFRALVCNTVFSF